MKSLEVAAISKSGSNYPVQSNVVDQWLNQ